MTSRSAPGRRWPSTPPRARGSRSSPARSASTGRSSRRRWRTWPRSREDRLGEYRIGELAAACAELGVTDHRFLGGPGRWRDSGMMGTEANDDPRCFWRADVNQAARALLDVIREVRPQVLVTYDANGFYGHPDHIQAHRVGLPRFPAGRRPRAGQVLRHRRARIRRGHHRDRRHRLPRCEAGGDARARHADHRGRPRSLRCPTRSGTRRSAWSTTPCWPGRSVRRPALAAVRQTYLRSSLLS